MTIKLRLNQQLDDLFRCVPVILKSGTNSGILKIQTVVDSKLKGTIPLTIQATSMQEERWLVQSIVDFEVDILKDDALAQSSRTK